MAFPTQRAMELPLLPEIGSVGGELRPAEAYVRALEYFQEPL